jgi:serine/threonine-protein kinase
MTTPLLQCPSCSAAISAESRFCSACGMEVGALSQMPTAPPRRGPGPAAAAQPARRISSDSIPAGGFTPGMILADRYRVIGLLGRGGMGEVYRADDLKLGQPVALKFLPKALASDPVRRERFFAEVRITRQLSHPNICRVYDIAEYEGQHFLSMEYIDGEDLASLIKRIGHLSNEKALDIARQLAAGLAAAHDRGVLHRDLKPSNIMIDGRGRVRITDFGIAVAIDDETHGSEISGTPAYMAPEQLAGKPATVRSDIYALGLILYEIYCGKRAFTATTIAELRAEKEGHAPTAPSDIRAGFDPIVERVIMRCLEGDPRSRPASASALAAALPGGDPLAAAIAAGETPSPEMVAASGEKEGFRPAVAMALLAIVIFGSIAAVAMFSRMTLVGLVPPAKPPEVLAERAREFLRNAGYSDAPADSIDFFGIDNDFPRYVADTYKGVDRWGRLSDFSAIDFVYRQTPAAFTRTLVYANPGQISTPLSSPGETVVVLNTDGRLVAFLAIPPEAEPPSAPPAPVDWVMLLFSEAGLDISKWAKADPERTPIYYADERRAWTGALPQAPNTPVRIEATAYRGKPVSFEVIGPWTPPQRFAPRQLQTSQKVANAIEATLLIVLIAGGLFFARANLRLGRGDRRGAARLALFLAALTMTAWLVGEHHSSTLSELGLFVLAICWTLFLSGLVWVLYMAIEPFVRRRWPQILVSWTRLLSGEWRDPIVGRDVLAGCAVGVTSTCINSLFAIAPSWFGGAANIDLNPYPIPTGIGPLAMTILMGATVFTLVALGYVFLFFILRTMLRREWAAAIAVSAIVPAFLSAPFQNQWLAVAGMLITTPLMFFLVVRHGLLGLAIYLFISELFLFIPMTLQTSAWFFGMGLTGFLIIGAIAVYGFRTSLGGRRLLDITTVQD